MEDNIADLGWDHTPNGQDGTPNKKEWEFISTAEFKKYQGDVERWIQKVLNKFKETEVEKQVYQKAFDSIDLIAKDQTQLLTLAEKDPEVAKVILDRYYDWISIEEFEEKLTWTRRENKIDVNKIVEETENRVTKKILAEASNKKFNKIVEKLWLDWDDLDRFKDSYKDLTQGKNVSVDDVNRYVKLAHIDVFGQSWWDLEKKLARATSSSNTASWSTPSKAKTADDILLEDMRKFMKERNPNRGS